MSNIIKLAIAIILVLFLGTGSILAFNFNKPSIEKQIAKVSANFERSSSSVTNFITSSSAQTTSSASSIKSSASTVSSSKVNTQSEDEQNAILNQDIFYFVGKLGQNTPIVIKIQKNSKLISSSDSLYTGEYLYVGVGESAISLAGTLKNGIFSLKENDFVSITIDPIHKTGEWSDGKNTYSISLQESEQNTVEAGLLKKYRTLKTDSLDLECQTQGKLMVGECNILDKSSRNKGNIKTIGLPKIIKYETEYVDVEFSFNGYSVCNVTRFRINNSTLKSELIETFSNDEKCRQEYIKINN